MVCREAGAHITTNVLVRDLERLGVVADGLPLFGGAQLAVDTTLVSPLHCDGCAPAGAADRDGVALAAARRRKERTYPELVAPWSRCRLFVMANEVGGRWSPEALAFLRQLAKVKARDEPPLMQRQPQQAWKTRWLAIMSCAAARAVSSSLLELRGHGGSDGVPMTHEVEANFRHALGLFSACFFLRESGPSHSRLSEKVCQVRHTRRCPRERVATWSVPPENMQKIWRKRWRACATTDVAKRGSWTVEATMEHLDQLFDELHCFWAPATFCFQSNEHQTTSVTLKKLGVLPFFLRTSSSARATSS